MENNLDDMPELEDLSEELKIVRGRDANSTEGSEISVKVIEKEQPKVETKPSQPDSNPINDNNNNNQQQHLSNGGFRFKKGFFLKGQNNNNTNTNTKEQITDLTHIKSNPTELPKNKLIDNVKNEVKSNNVSSSTLLGDVMGKKDEWLTPDLLNKIAQKPQLLKYFMDPRFTEAIQLMQKDPQKAKETYGSNPEFNEFIKEFSSIMAEHFNNVGQKQQNYDKEVEDILKDPKVSYYINILQTKGRLDVDEIEKDPKTFEKIKKLIDKGVLKMQKENS
jgi:hypothetical protein